MQNAGREVPDQDSQRNSDGDHGRVPDEVSPLLVLLVLPLPQRDAVLVRELPPPPLQHEHPARRHPVVRRRHRGPLLVELGFFHFFFVLIDGQTEKLRTKTRVWTKTKQIFLKKNSNFFNERCMTSQQSKNCVEF